MKIKDILKEKDSGIYDKFMEMKDKNKCEELSEYDIRELMSHSFYKRHKGAIKQVK